MITGQNESSGQIFRLHKAAFQRLPDSESLSYWREKYDSGKNTKREVAKSFLDSYEYKRRHGIDLSDEQYIKSLYTHILGRLPDADGMNKFKSGFFVDNFTNLKTQEVKGIKVKNSLDPVNKELRPQHYTTSIDLQAGPVQDVDPSVDRAYLAPEGTNVRRQADGVVTLDYTEVDWLSQQ